MNDSKFYCSEGTSVLRRDGKGGGRGVDGSLSLVCVVVKQLEAMKGNTKTIFVRRVTALAPTHQKVMSMQTNHERTPAVMYGIREISTS